MGYAQRIYAKAIADGLPSRIANYLVYQSAFETAGWTSNVFRSCNNGFGYKWVGQSVATGGCLVSPEGDQYALYRTLEDSVHEMVLWIRRRQASGVFPADLNTISTLDLYASYLKSADFFGAPVGQYAMGLLRWYTEIGDLSSGVKVSGVVLLLVALGLVYRKKIFPGRFK